MPQGAFKMSVAIEPPKGGQIVQFFLKFFSKFSLGRNRALTGDLVSPEVREVLNDPARRGLLLDAYLDRLSQERADTPGDTPSHRVINAGGNSGDHEG